VTEDLLLTLFGNLGSCKGCKIIREVSRLTAKKIFPVQFFVPSCVVYSVNLAKLTCVVTGWTCLLMCVQAGSDLYAFVEFEQHSDAQLALMAMNKRIVLGRVSACLSSCILLWR